MPIFCALTDPMATQVPKRKVWIAVGFSPCRCSKLEVPVGFDSLAIVLHDAPCVFLVVMQQYSMETHATVTPVPR